MSCTSDLSVEPEEFNQMMFDGKYYSEKTFKPKNIKFVNCEIHGKAPSTLKKDYCDKCYRHENYIIRKEKNRNKKRFCLLHGFTEINALGQCIECVKNRKIY